MSCFTGLLSAFSYSSVSRINPEEEKVQKQSHSKGLFSALPKDTLTIIFSFTSTEDLTKFSLSSKEWHLFAKKNIQRRHEPMLKEIERILGPKGKHPQIIQFIEDRLFETPDVEQTSFSKYVVLVTRIDLENRERRHEIVFSKPKYNPDFQIVPLYNVEQQKNSSDVLSNLIYTHTGYKIEALNDLELEPEQKSLLKKMEFTLNSKFTSAPSNCPQ